MGLDCRWPAQVLVPVLSAGASWRRRASHVRGCRSASTLLVAAAQVSLLLREAPKGIARMLIPAMISAAPPHADGTEQRYGAGAAAHVALQVSVHPAARKDGSHLLMVGGPHLWIRWGEQVSIGQPSTPWLDYNQLL